MNELEYATLRSAGAFGAWIDEWSIRRIGQNGVSLLHSERRWDKKMIEEVMPVRKYVREFHAYHNISVQMNPERGNDSDGYDAKVQTPKGDLVEYLQVTHIPAKDEHIDRLILSGGYTFKAGPGRPEKITKYAYDYEEYERQRRVFDDLSGYTQRVLECVQKKANNAYQRPSTLIVQLDPDIIVEDKHRFDTVATHVLESLKSRGPFYRIVLLAFGSGLIRGFETTALNC